MDTNFDFIILGSGPNGLQAAAYLAKAGEKVLVLEQRYECGGGLWTEESTYPGFLHSTHAIYMMMTEFAPVYSDFDMEQKYGVKHIHPDMTFCMPFEDGTSLCFYKDLERTVESIAQFSEKDAQAYREFYEISKRIVDEYIGPATYVPPMGALDAIVKMQQHPLGEHILEYGERTPEDIIESTFENDKVRLLLLYLACHWGVKYDQPSMGYLTLLYINRAHNYKMVKGGSHMVAQALNKVVHEHKGVVKTNQRVTRILVEDGKAVGVDTKEGTTYTANKAVLSSLNPIQTFKDLVGEEHLDGFFSEKVDMWEWESCSLLGVHPALEERPNFTAAQSNPDVNDAFIYILGYESVQDFKDYMDAVYRGEMPEKMAFNCCFPSNHDPSLAPPGNCVGFISCIAPHDIDGDDGEKWMNYKFRTEQAERCLDLLEKFAPNLDRDKVFQTYISTPADIGNKFPDMHKGSIKQGAYTPFQMGYLRPNEECSHNRTPIENLYLGGASVYPGGCVIWGPGYLAAERIAEDFDINKWWSEAECVTRMKESGLH
jgi:phytoene dehydrogenase-like protein